MFGEKRVEEYWNLHIQFKYILENQLKPLHELSSWRASVLQRHSLGLQRYWSAEILSAATLELQQHSHAHLDPQRYKLRD